MEESSHGIRVPTLTRDGGTPEAAPEPTASTGPASPGAAGTARAWWRLHRLTLVVLAGVLAIAAVLAVVARMASDDGDVRLLDSQLEQVATAVDASVPPLQESLIAADRVAGRGSVGPFRSFAASEVGAGAAFRSVSLWQVSHGTARLLVDVGPPLVLASRPATRASFFASVRPSTQLTVTGVLAHHPPVYGLAEWLPKSDVIVYAEAALPPGARVPSGSPLAGLDFALFLGRSTARADLLEASIPLPVEGLHASEVEPFGSSAITVVATLAGPGEGQLSRDLPWLAIGGGLVLAILAGVAAEGLLRRRELAESLATDSERRYGEQREIAGTLQRAMKPQEDLSFPGVEIATRYVPGVSDLQIGGDWFDAIAVDGGGLFLAVGDVSGRGLQAATTMAHLRRAIRSYAVRGVPPDVVLSRLDELLDLEVDECFSTVICALVDVPSREVVLASAGHPPALVRDADGARFLDVPVGTPIGVSSARARVSTTTTLAPGSVLLLYTDGLVERRGQTLDVGLDQLATAVVGLDATAESVLRGVLDALCPEGSADDVAILGVRWLT